MTDAPLAALLDRAEITDLIHRYAEAIDRRDQALLATLFTADAKLHYGAWDAPASTLVESWRPGTVLPFVMTHHLVCNIRVVLKPDGRARAITYLHAVHRARYRGVLMDEEVRARYLDRLAKVDGGWRFAERTLVFDWSRLRPADATAWWDLQGEGAAVGAQGEADPATGFLYGDG